MSSAAMTHDVKAAPPLRSGSRPLPVNRPGDTHEQEAERVARDVMSGTSVRPAWSLSRVGIAAPLQRDAAAGVGSPTTAPPVVHRVLSGEGNPLDRSTRKAMESRFGYDFGDVRVFTDSAAATSARAVAANAYTVGNKVVFDKGRYAPESQSGRRLLAHELAHVVQQGGAQGTAATYEESERQAELAAQDDARSVVLGRRPVGMACAPGDPPPPADVAAPAAGEPGKKDMTKEHKYWSEVDEEKGLTYKIAEGELGKPGTVENHRSDYQQGKLSSGTGDDAGHLIADLFGGAGGQENLSLQNWRANESGTYKKLENSFAKKLKQNYKIKVKVTDTTHIGENRPFSRKVEWTETAPDGKVSSYTLLFANTHTPESRAKQGVPATTDGDQKDNVIHADFKNKKRATTDEEIAEASKPLRKPKRPRATKAPAISGQVKPPKVTESAKAAEAPKTVETPKAVEAAKTVEIPKAAEAPKVAEVPHVAESPAAVEAGGVPEVPTPGVSEVPQGVGKPQNGGNGSLDRLASTAAGVIGLVTLVGQLLPDYAGKEAVDAKFKEAVAGADAQAKLRALQPALEKATGDQYYNIRYRIHYSISTSPKPQAFPEMATVKSVEIVDITLSGSEVSTAGEIDPKSRPNDAKPVMGGGWYWYAQQDGIASSKVESGGQRRERAAREAAAQEKAKLQEKLRLQQRQQRKADRLAGVNEAHVTPPGVHFTPSSRELPSLEEQLKTPCPNCHQGAADGPSHDLKEMPFGFDVPHDGQITEAERKALQEWLNAKPQ